MLPVSPWIVREFRFDQPKWMYPNLIERIRGGPARAEDAIRGVSDSLLLRRTNSTWSIQENIGHLLDIEPLMAGRLDDLVDEAPELRAWEESNRATWEADHNSRSIQTLLVDFRQLRSKLVSRLTELDDSLIERAALHPRLKKPMRTIDLVFFIAEHDDYHFAKISAIKNSFFKGL